MAANTDPIYSRQPNNQVGGAVLGPTAVTAQDGTGSLVQIFRADQTNGSWVSQIILKPIGSPAATVIRIFYCTATGTFTSGTTNAASNTSMIAESTTIAVTSSNTTGQAEYIIPVQKYLAPDHKLLIGFGTSTGAAGTGFATTVFGGDL